MTEKLTLAFADNYPVPFWFINDFVDKNEILRQLDLMKDAKVTEIIVHPRDGIVDTGFLTKRFFEDIEFIVKSAATRNIKVWLYDEDAFPSGNEGGIIAMEHPEFVAQTLERYKFTIEKDGAFKAELGKAKAIKAFRIRRGEVTDLSDCFGSERSAWFLKSYPFEYFPSVVAKEHRRSATYFPKRVFYSDDLKRGDELVIFVAKRFLPINRYGSCVDNLNKKCVDKFKKDVYGAYFAKIPKGILKNVVGIFTDEPSAGSFPPWSDGLPDEFYKQHKYSLTENLYKIFDGDDESAAKLRVDYFKTCSGLFYKNYVKNLAEYCHENGMRFIGHFEAEENPYYQTLKANNVYKNQWALDYPGFDCITDNVGDNGENIELFIGAKLVSSVANQKGANLTICECFGVNPFNFGLNGMKKVAGWLFIAGATTLVPHGFYYGYSGRRKYDAGKSFFFQDENFKDYPKFAEFSLKYGKLLTDSQSKAKTLLVYPNYEFADFALKDDLTQFKRAVKKFQTVFRFLLENHIEFDLTDCDYIENHFTRNARVGRKKYENVIITEYESPTMRNIVGKVCAVAEVFSFSDEKSFDIMKLKRNSAFAEIRGINCEGKTINTLLKRVKNGEYLFLYNNSHIAAEISVGIRRNAYVYDEETSEYERLSEKNGEGRINLAGYEFKAVFFTKKNIVCRRDYVLKPERNFNEEYETSPEWTYRLPVKVKSYIGAYEFTAEYNGKEVLQKNTAADMLKNIYGADIAKLPEEFPRAVYDSSEIKIKNYPIRACFKSIFTVSGAKKILFDKDTFIGNPKIYLNGNELKTEQAKKTLVYDVNNYYFDISKIVKDGENELIIFFENGEESNGIIGELYVI